MTTSKKRTRRLLSSKDIEDRNIKVRISTYLDMDVLKTLKAEAKKKHMGYQTLLNQKLREALFEDQSLETRISRIERRLHIVR